MDPGTASILEFFKMILLSYSVEALNEHSSGISTARETIGTIFWNE